jgi:hypothetical protein
VNLVADKYPGYGQVSQTSHHDVIRKIHRKGDEVLQGYGQGKRNQGFVEALVGLRDCFHQFDYTGLLLIVGRPAILYNWDNVGGTYV